MATQNDADAILNEVRSVMMGLARDLSQLTQQLMAIRDGLDKALKESHQKNSALRTEKIHAAMHSLTGSDDVNAANALNRINQDNSERQKKLQELETRLSLIQGEKGKSTEYQSLAKQLSQLNEQNKLAQNVQKALITDTLNRGQPNNLDTDQLLKTVDAVNSQIGVLNTLNQESRKELSMVARNKPEQPTPPTSGGPKLGR